MQIEIIKPIGYCAGVNNAINIANKAKKENPFSPIYVLGRLVHNENVIQELKKEGIETIESDFEAFISTLSNNDIVVFTAHGHEEKYENLLKKKGIKFYDATCPKVKENISIIKNELSKNKQVVYIGYQSHPETEAAISISPDVILFNIKEGKMNRDISDDSFSVINQTTLNFSELESIHDSLKKEYPYCHIYDEICSATRIRQNNIQKISPDVDLIVIVGDKNSSNTLRLFEIAKSFHSQCDVINVSSAEELTKYNLKDKKKAAIASGASTPLYVIDCVVSFLKKYN